LIQEHISFRVWPLVESWDMPKETTIESSDGGLVRLKYTFRFREKFDEPNDDWLKCIEATSDELLGAYSKAEDNALSVAFGGQGKKRLNRVLMRLASYTPIIASRCEGKEKEEGYRFGHHSCAEEQNVKVLTHRPCYIEPAMVPEFVEGASSTVEARQAASITPSVEERTVMPKTPIVEPVEAKVHKAEEPKVEEIMKMPKILSPPTEAKLPKVQKASAATPKRRRMANVLDAVLETRKALSPAPTKKIAEAAKAQAEAETGQAEAKATKAQAEAEAGCWGPSSFEGPQKRNLTMSSKYGIWTGTFGLRL
jgi:hypothetical protein